MTTTTHSSLRLALAAILLAAASTAAAQSLADVARRTAESRATAGEAKTYSNGDLTPDFTSPEPAPAATATSAGVTDGKAGLAAPDAAEPSPVGEDEARPRKELGEDYWRGRADRIRGAIESQKADIAALRQRVESMADLDGSTAAQERNLTQARLSKAESDLVQLEQRWSAFEATARAKDVPPAWIR